MELRGERRGERVWNEEDDGRGERGVEIRGEGRGDRIHGKVWRVRDTWEGVESEGYIMGYKV